MHGLPHPFDLHPNEETYIDVVARFEGTPHLLPPRPFVTKTATLRPPTPAALQSARKSLSTRGDEGHELGVGQPNSPTTLQQASAGRRCSPARPGFRAVFATVAALANADELPGPGDDETTFGPGRAFVRRVSSAARGQLGCLLSPTYTRALR
jgi:hypothetical protein